MSTTMQTTRKYGTRFATDVLAENISNIFVGATVTVHYKQQGFDELYSDYTEDSAEVTKIKKGPGNSVDAWISLPNDKAYLHINTETNDLYFNITTSQESDEELIELDIGTHE